ncbi:chemotaxis protein CheW [Nitratiruptor sp. YY08-10]|uniref:chemotaxis protein CheW n=1 Tax=Nitratiruptor sp. YY08-10 TaxID=2724897 RepID=UPI001F19FC37
MKWIVDVEKVYDVAFMPEYIIGEIKQNDDVYFLVCLKKLLKLGDCEDLKNKSAIILSIKDKDFAILVDEIHKIEEIENIKYNNDKIEVINFDEEVVEILKEDFFYSSVDVPTIKPSYQKQKEELLDNTLETDQDETSLILFKLGKEIFAVDASMVQFVEVLEDAKKGMYIPKEEFIEGVYLVKNRLLHLINLGKLLHVDSKLGENIFIFKKENLHLGLSVGEILNIVNVQTENINIARGEEILDRFFIYENQVISIISNEYLQNLIEMYGITSHDKNEVSKRVHEYEEFLIVSVDGKRLAIKMENIKGIHEEHEVHITRSLEHREGVEGIVAIDSRSYLLFDLEYLATKTESQGKDGLILIMQTEVENRLFDYALLIGSIQEIIQVPKDDVHIVVSEKEHFIKGTVEYHDEVYNIINTKWIVEQLQKNA